MSSAAPEITSFTTGPYGNNCYVVTPGAPAPVAGSVKAAKTPCWIVDASFEPGAMIEFIQQRGLVPEALLLTHAHVDHIVGIAEVRRAFPGVPILVHPLEADWLSDPVLNLSALGGMAVTSPSATGFLNHNDTLTLGDDTWRVAHTPGHSPGGICLIHEPSRVAIVGDALFAGSIGRTDFPGSDFNQLEAAIRAHLYSLPDDTRVLPGHGATTTIGREKRSNPFVRPG